jgi:hypothetical protein
MSLLRRSKREQQPGADREDPVVRQYRYLLRTAPADALEAIHQEALAVIPATDRGTVLRTIQEQLVAGLRLDADDVPALSRLLVLGERRSPGALLRHCHPEVLRRLADAALVSEAAFGLLTGYAAWDGEDPAPPEEEAWEARAHRNWADPKDLTDAQRAYGGGYGAGYSGGGAGGGDGGGG